MKQKVYRKHPKEQIRRYQPPYLPLKEYQIKVEVQRKGTNDIQRTSRCGEEGSREV